jgi:uncharacterized membrane protein
MKTTNALVAAALAGVFAAGTTVSQAAPSIGAPVASEKEKEDCPGKEKEKDKKKDSGTSISAEADKDKDKKKDGEIL